MAAYRQVCGFAPPTATTPSPPATGVSSDSTNEVATNSGNSTAPVVQGTATTSGGVTSTDVSSDSTNEVASNGVSDGTSISDVGSSPPPSVTVFVIKMAVWIPMTKESFISDGQTKFKISMANAAGVAATDIVIVKIENINRARLRHLLVRCVYTLSRNVKFWYIVCVTFPSYVQEEGIRVDFTVKTSTRADADKLKDTMTEDNINEELAKSGLPNVAIVEAPTVEQVDSSKSMPSDTDDEVYHEASVY